jgi:hypothetical protein
MTARVSTVARVRVVVKQATWAARARIVARARAVARWLKGQREAGLMLPCQSPLWESEAANASLCSPSFRF